LPPNRLPAVGLYFQPHMDHNIISAIVRPIGAVVLLYLIALLADFIRARARNAWSHLIESRRPRHVDGTWLHRDVP
jgi:hypothetical protein